MQQSLAKYTGRHPQIADPLMRAAHLFNVTMSERFYPPGTADWNQKSAQVVLNEETAEYLYTCFTPPTVVYEHGSRPVLERLLGRILKPEMTDREKLFAILRYCHHDIAKEYENILPKKMIILNASEEELLKFNGGHCEDRARLIICLCQMAGLPARFVASSSYWDPAKNYLLTGGHAVVEVRVEGNWAYFDSLRDFYCLRADGQLASLWHILTHPEIVEMQPPEVYATGGETREWFIHYRDENLTRKQVITLANYGVMDYKRYDWKWVPYRFGPGDPQGIEVAQFTRQLRERLLADIGIQVT